MLGFDTLYENNWNDRAIVELSEVEERIILTRNIGLLKHESIQSGYWLRSQHLQEQIFEVIRYFNLTNQFQPFTRCLECNGTILLVEKESVLDRLPPKTIEYFNRFYQCPSCKKVYWKGSHYENMQKFIHACEEIK